MNRFSIVAASALAALAALAGTSSLASATPGISRADAARVAKVQSRHTSLGTVLVTGSGFTLYRFTRDPRNKDTCAKVSKCPANWPALRTSGTPIAGPGVKRSLLSSIALAGGGRQVTYAGHPLYTYAAASEPAETVYAGAMQFGGTWDAVSLSGNLVK
jgi:predicted lipoprotein with Yx(FWY)xxD motif